MSAPFTIICKIWGAAQSGCQDELKKYIADHAMILINGKRYCTSDFVKYFASIGVHHYDINMMEVLCSDECNTQVVFESQAFIARDDQIEPSGNYYVTVTWSSIDSECKVIYLMAQHSEPNQCK